MINKSIILSESDILGAFEKAQANEREKWRLRLDHELRPGNFDTKYDLIEQIGEGRYSFVYKVNFIFLPFLFFFKTLNCFLGEK